MKYKISKKDFIKIIEQMIIKSNFHLTKDVKNELKCKYKDEVSPIGKKVLKNILENSEIARKLNKPLCQDSGVCVFLIKVGYKCYLDFNIQDAINEAIILAHKNNYLRGSIVDGPFSRVNTKYNSPGIFHIEIVEGDRLEIEFSAKGAGSENMSKLKIFRPTISLDEICKWIIQMIYEAGGKSCPPITLGIGIGGNFETCAILAKKALFIPLNQKNKNKKLSSIEDYLYNEINKLGIGAMGLGGKSTCIGVKILTAPCHIASLPVAININCHSSRHMKIVI